MEKQLPKKWQEYLATKPETGMGYQVVNIILDDGRKIEDVVILQSALIAEVRGAIPELILKRLPASKSLTKGGNLLVDLLVSFAGRQMLQPIV